MNQSAEKMDLHGITVHVGDDREIETFLADRIYEYNASATGYFDAESFNAVRRDQSGAIEAGICGYTWGRCSYVSYLWVKEALRGSGVGTALLDAAERHARARGCLLVVLGSHSFQAPSFYMKRGYEPQCEIRDHPVGFTSVMLTKRL
jgi:GNAT superfamily N-acetyltransferase